MSVHGLQCCPALPPQHPVTGVLTPHSLYPWPVDQVQVKRVALELLQGLTDSRQGTLIAMVFRGCACTKCVSLDPHTLTNTYIDPHTDAAHTPSLLVMKMS